MRGKLIVVEGTDCSGKETQTKELIKKLEENNIKAIRYSFPMYDTPTGKIVGGPYLGKKYICDGWFSEGATHVNYKVASLLYAADRLYNIDKIINDLDNGYYVILDRYVYSNMAHQGGKVYSSSDRYNIYKWLEELEFNLLKLPVPDIKIFLHMPVEYSKILKQNRSEMPDQHEQDENYLKNAEQAYLEIAEIYDFKIFECVKDGKINSIQSMNDEIYDYVSSIIK